MDFKNLNELIKYSQTVNNFKNGEIVNLIEENQCAYYNDGEWNILKKAKMENEGLSLNLYDLNKTLISQLPRMEEEECKDYINNYFVNGNYFMLLCKELSYFTIFKRGNNTPEFSSLGPAVVTCIIEDLGNIILVNDSETELEIWIQDPNEEIYCLHLFNCEPLIVEFGEV